MENNRKPSSHKSVSSSIPNNDPPIIFPPDPPDPPPNITNELLLQQLQTVINRLNSVDSELQSLRNNRHVYEGRRNHQNDKGQDQEETNNDEFDPGNRQFVRRPHAKLEFPKFEKGDPQGWILKAEKYFRYYQISEDLKVDIAAINLEGDALNVFSWVSSSRIIRDWDDLVQILQEHFGPAEFQNPDMYLCNIKQKGSASEYRQEFINRTSQVRGWPEHCLLGVFLNGLKEELKYDVKIQNPRTVHKACSLAIEFEAKVEQQCENRSGSKSNINRIQKGGINGQENRNYYSGKSYSNYFPDYSQSISSSIYSQKPLNAGSYPANTNFPIITEQERQQRRDKGLCFKCGDKFTPGHRCTQSSLRLMEISENPENPPNDENQIPQSEEFATTPLFQP